MDERDMEQMLSDLICVWESDDDMLGELGIERPESRVVRLATFEQAGVLTTDAGLVLSLHDGSEYRMTIKRSR